jgi:hypothetical protein
VLLLKSIVLIVVSGPQEIKRIPREVTPSL